jgi:hypothetical protein
MAQIANQTISISISKLIKDNEQLDSVLSSEQLLSLFESLPSVVEQIIDDTTLVIEVTI